MSTIAEDQKEQATGVLGIERWVQFAFIGGALFTFWFMDHLIGSIWNVFAEPNANAITGIAALIAIGGAFIAYRHPKSHKFSHEVAGELSKVTWPTRKETWAQTIVVVIVSVLAAIVLGLFDAAWSAVTDLIYKV